MRISDWSSDVCSSDLHAVRHLERVIVVRLRAEVPRLAVGPFIGAGLGELHGRRLARLMDSGFWIRGAGRKEDGQTDNAQRSPQMLRNRRPYSTAEHNLPPQKRQCITTPPQNSGAIGKKNGR